MKLLALCIYFWFKLLHHDSVRQLNLSQLTHRLTVPGFGVADRRHQTMDVAAHFLAFGRSTRASRNSSGPLVASALGAFFGGRQRVDHLIDRLGSEIAGARGAGGLAGGLLAGILRKNVQHRVDHTANRPSISK
jgi:hypothetical protein